MNNKGWQVRLLTSLVSSAIIVACSDENLQVVKDLIDALTKETITSFQYRRYHEGYPWFALAAFGLFLLAEVLSRTLWRRLP